MFLLRSVGLTDRTYSGEESAVSRWVKEFARWAIARNPPEEVGLAVSGGLERSPAVVAQLEGTFPLSRVCCGR